MTQHLFIVTGASRGLGEALAHCLLHPRHEVVAIARHASTELEAAARESLGPLQMWRHDLIDATPLAARLEAWLTQHPTAASATLINNAGVITEPGPLHQATSAEIVRALRVGLEATLLLSAAFLRATQHWTVPRKLLNISSGLGRRAMAGSAVYCTAKAGMDHLSRALALEQSEVAHGARVVSLAPGIIDTDMQVQLRGADPKAFPESERFARFHADGLLVSPLEAAQKIVRFLHRPGFGNEAITDLREQST